MLLNEKFLATQPQSQAETRTASLAYRKQRYIDTVIENSPPPTQGDGVHSWLWKLSLSIAWAFDSESDVVAKVLEAGSGVGRDLTREATLAARNAFRTSQPPTGFEADFDEDRVTADSSSYKSWPERDWSAMKNLFNEKPFPLKKFVDVEHPPTQNPREILETLFPHDPLLCLATRADDFITKRLSEFPDDLKNFSLLVPNEMSAVQGKVAHSDRLSYRTNDNVAEKRKFIVIECDFSQDDIDRAGGISRETMCSTVIAELARIGSPLGVKLIALISSGGKSLHAFFSVSRLTDEQVRTYYERAVTLGADRAVFTKSQLCRLPGGTRDDGNAQTVYYFNPNNL